MKVDCTKINKREHIVILILSVVIATMVTGFFVWQKQLVAQAKAQEQLAREVLRFHILANSDSDEDQALKMTVKEAVISYMREQMPSGLDVDDAKSWMRSHTDEITSVGKETIESQGYDYTVSAAVTTCYFPDKTYGDVMFPAGNYEALRVEIGAAKGRNWWCVLYPELCFQDAVNAVVPEEGKKKLEEALTEEEYDMVTAGSDFKIKWYFLPDK